MDRSVLIQNAAGSVSRTAIRAAHLWRRFRRSDEGSTAIEYAIMIAGIALVIVATVYALGEKTLGLYEAVQGAYDLVMN